MSSEISEAWLTGLGFGTLGCGFVIYGLYSFF